MRNILKSILALSAIFSVASCNVDNIGTLYQHEGSDNGVTFTQANVSYTELSASMTSLVVTLGRAASDAAQTVNIASTLPEGIVVPTSVSFAAGQASADLVLDLSGMSVGTAYKGKISLASESDYNSLGISSVNVTLQKADGFDVYRLIDPYGEVFPYNDPGDYRLGVKWVIDATDPNAVTFEQTKLGVDWGYGEMEAAMLEPGKMVNKVITFPVKGLVVFDDDGGYYANNNGAFELDLNL